mmetsp:Transcript_11011/g.26020  ORF Transcript_11011/g.26020 Transcript_11011/m.26020 type:complete len:429 (+) Transcript_11011:180-1466(+)
MLPAAVELRNHVHLFRLSAAVQDISAAFGGSRRGVLDSAIVQSSILFGSCHFERAFQVGGLALHQGNSRLKVKDLLTPMRVPVFWPGRQKRRRQQLRRVVATLVRPRFEIGGKPPGNRRYRPTLSVSVDRELERTQFFIRTDPLGVFDGARHHVVELDRFGIREDRFGRQFTPSATPQKVVPLLLVKVFFQNFHVDTVDLFGGLLEFGPVGHGSGVIAAVDPPIFFVLNGSNVHGAVGGEHQSRGRFQEFVAGPNERIQHALSQEEISHPFTDHNVHDALWMIGAVRFQAVFLDGQLDVLDGPLDDGDNVFDTVRLHDLPCVLGHVGVLDCVNLSGTGLGRPDGQNSRSGSHVHDDLVLENIRIPQNCRMVGRHSVVIGKHLLLVVQLGIGTEIVGEIGSLCLLVSVEGGDFSIAGCVGKLRFVLFRI